MIILEWLLAMAQAVLRNKSIECILERTNPRRHHQKTMPKPDANADAKLGLGFVPVIRSPMPTESLIDGLKEL